MNLGARLKIARKKRGLKQEQLAELVGVSQAMISALEKRDSKTTEHVFGFARALKINPEWLQAGKGESGLDADAWRPTLPDLPADQAELLRNYNAAGQRWRLSLLLMSRLRGDAEQNEMAGGMNILLAKIAATPVPDADVEKALQTSRHGFPPGQPHRFHGRDGVPQSGQPAKKPKRHTR